MSRAVPMIHVSDVAATARGHESIGFTLDGAHVDGGEMLWARLTIGASELMLNVGRIPS